MNAGIYSLSEAEYHTDPATTPSLSASVAKILLNQSPLHAWLAHPKLNPNYHEEESSRFDIGSIAHALFLEGNDSKICVIEADDWRTKAAKEARDQARANGMLPILTKHERTVRRMADIAREFVLHSELTNIMSIGKPEQTLLWKEGDIWCRSRLDWLTNDHKIILDYKTTENAEPDSCGKRMFQLDYHLQAAFYIRGLEALGAANPTFVFLFQEIEEPFACSLIGLSATMYEIAQARVEKAIQLWSECLKSNKWPGYPKQICYAEPPAWALNQLIIQSE